MTKIIIKKIFLYILLILLFGIIIYPFIILVFTSLKTQSELLVNPGGIPRSLAFENYKTVFNIAEIPKSFINSLIITLASLAGQMFFGSLTAYALTKMKFRRSRLFLNLFMIPIIFSIQVVALPIFILFKYMNLLNSYFGAILIYTATGIATAIFILTGFMKSVVPDEMIEAATIDGASYFGIYLKVILPLLKTPFAAICVVNGLFIWNDFFVPLLFFTRGNIKTLPLGIYLFSSVHRSQWTLISTDVIFSVAPFILLYLFFQKFFVEGIVSGSLKG